MFTDVEQQRSNHGGPRPVALCTSLALHGMVFGWAVFGPVAETQRPQSLYQQVIAGHENQLVWYAFRDKLPEVSPLERHGISKPPRADVKTARQTVVSRSRNAPRARQMIWRPAPRLALQHDLNVPNLLAFQTPHPIPPPVRPKPKLFVPPPPPKPVATPAPLLPAAPHVKIPAGRPQVRVSGIETALAIKPKLRPFVPPPEQRPGVKPAPSSLAPAPRLTLPAGKPEFRATGIEAALANKPKPRTFVPPPEPPESGSKAGPAQPLPAAPLVQGPAGSPRIQATGIEAALAARPQPRAFVPPPGTRANTGDGPPVQTAIAGPPGNLTAAIVGLKPSESLNVTIPDASRNAQFAGAPEKRNTGGSGEPVETARIFVPDLMIHNGGNRNPSTLLATRVAPTSMANLRAAERYGRMASASVAAGGLIAKPAVAPDPRLEGRDVFSLTIQMPNVTSYIGSWIMWFAERGGESGHASKIQPPVPLRKVDPKYFPSAMADRVEGVVRLAAVIRKDGNVDSIELLHHLDGRLDRSAEEALGKWKFEPALRNGNPVAVDVVVEIPFRLAPQTKR